MPEVAGAGQQHRRAGGVDDLQRPRHRGPSRPAGRTRSRRLRGRPRPRRGTDRTRPRRRPRRRARRRPAYARAFATAPRAASTRLVWPEPIPISRPSRTSTIAFDVTPRTRRQARSRSRRSSSVGPRFEATVHVAGSSASVSGARDEDGTAGACGGIRSGPVAAAGIVGGQREGPRRVGDWAWWPGSSWPPASKPGATTTSRKIETSASAIAASTGRVRATTPPNADTGSPASAACQASSGVGSLGGAARVRVLDDDAGRAAQRAAQCRRGRRVEDVVVRQGLALERRLAGRERAVVGASSPGAGSGPPAGAGSRRSAASRPSRARRSGSPDTDPRLRAGRVHRAAGRRPPPSARGRTSAIRAS